MVRGQGAPTQGGSRPFFSDLVVFQEFRAVTLINVDRFSASKLRAFQAAVIPDADDKHPGNGSVPPENGTWATVTSHFVVRHQTASSRTASASTPSCLEGGFHLVGRQDGGNHDDGDVLKGGYVRRSNK